MTATTLTQLIETAVQLEPGETLYLAGLGWLNPKRYAGYTGRNPKTGQPIEVKPKASLLFMADPAFIAEVNGEAFAPASFDDERQRFFHAIHSEELTEPDPTLEETQVEVLRFDWADAIAETVRRELLTLGVAELPGLARFEVRDMRPMEGRPPRRTIIFRLASDLKAALAGRIAH